MITVRLKGGLGNQMFQYAFGRSLSIKKKVDLGFDLRFINDRLPRSRFVFRRFDLDLFGIQPRTCYSTAYPFGIIYPIIAYEKIIRKAKIKKCFFGGWCYFEINHRFDREINVGLNCSWFDGYFQSYRYFLDHDDVIRSDFSTKDVWTNNQRSMVDSINRTDSVCLNVRRTDFVGGGSVTALGQEYYNSAYRSIKAAVPSCKVFVFSDDIEWCRANLKFIDHPTYVTHDLKGEKLFDYFRLMKSCKHFIVPNSTFAWWAAYLSKICQNKSGIIFAPEKWCESGSEVNNELLFEWWLKV